MEDSPEMSTPLLKNKISYSSTNSVGGMNESYGESDPMIKDKKHLELSGLEVIPLFLVNVLLLLPIWIALLLPLTLLYQGLLYVWNAIFKSLGLRSKRKKPDAEVINVAASANVTQKQGDREHDLVIFGATGFTGHMAAVYIAKRYGSKFKWAIAGRRLSALQDLRSKLAAIDPSLSTLPIVIADTGDISSLEVMVKKTKVIISTTGPFAKYGSDLVALCSVSGTDYCDITGETDWVRGMIDRHDSAAQLSGARIVHFCGHDCVPWDLAVLECSKHLKAKGDSLREVNFYDEISSSPSGGTIATIFHALNAREKLKSSLGFDPMLKDTTGSKSKNEFIVQNTQFLKYSDQYKSWVGPFLMSAVMANCIRRSNAVNNYSSKLTYRESVVYPSFMAGSCTVIGLMVFGTALFLPPLKWLLASLVLPAPGQGPSEATMDTGFLKVTALAKGNNGNKVKCVFYFPTDPGYRDTARMLVESGLVLALEGDKVKVGGGSWTPATCQGDLLTARLVASGSTISVQTA